MRIRVVSRMRRSKYTENAIKRMIENYSALKAAAGTQPGRPLDTLVRMADLDRALDRLPMDLWRVVLVHGLIGVPTREAGVELQISHTAVGKRFQRGIEELYFYMNQEEMSEPA